MTAVETAPGRPAETTPRSQTRLERPRAWWPILLKAAPMLVLLLLLVYPLSQIVMTSLENADGAHTGEAWGLALSDPEVLSALWTTLRVAIMATLGCMVLGSFIAVILALVPFPGAGLVTRLIETVVSFPSFLIPLAFGTLFGPVGLVNTALAKGTGAEEGPIQIMNSIHGVVLAEVAFFTPFVVRPVLAMLKDFPKTQIDVASSLGAHPLTILRRIVLPAALPVLGAATILVFMLTLNEFGIILFTGAQGVTTLPLLVYTRSIVSFDLPGAAAIACIQAVISMLIYGVYALLLLRRKTP
ncbi:2-aminoethylphosphonate ABC transporter permease subunit [Curtobacterium sp. S6]|uniref:2-aminoethylphosphonate ABC transporter permease subunit n=1 Tax=Curtobacterium sp. S6 TaxID=1479623 RepID=UPI00068D9717|nr:2-aminoethylphosphonate ABC transporter permease subunit [Curtobacterium sp. S6]